MTLEPAQLLLSTFSGEKDGLGISNFCHRTLGFDSSASSRHSRDRDLCGILQKRRTNTKQPWETQGQQGTSAILTLSYYHFRLS